MQAPVKRLTFYMGGKWANRIEIHMLIEQLEDLGARVTHDWTRTKADDPPTEEQQHDAAEKDVNGVRDADVVILLMTDKTYAYRGTCTELGVALGCCKEHIWIVGPSTADAARNVFWHHPRVRHFEKWADLLAAFEPLLPHSD